MYSESWAFSIKDGDAFNVNFAYMRPRHGSAVQVTLVLVRIRMMVTLASIVGR